MLHPILDISNFNVVVTFSGRTSSVKVTAKYQSDFLKEYSCLPMDSSQSSSSKDGILEKPVCLSCPSQVRSDVLIFQCHPL